MKPSRARYGVVGLAIGLAVLSYVQRVAISQAAGPISHDLHLSKAQMGFVFGAFGLSYALFEIPIGLLGDRIGVRRVLLQIVAAWSFFTALTGAAWNVASLCVIRFLFGAGEAGCFPNLTRMLSVWLPARERVTAQALMWACTRWGGAATPPLVLACIGLFGWRWAFVAFAGLGLVWCAIFFLWFKDDPAKHPSVDPAELQLLESSRALMSHGDAKRQWTSLLLTPQVFALVLQYFCFSFVWYFYITWLPTYLREARGQTPAHAAALSVIPLLFGGFGSLLTGLAPARLPHRAIAFCGFLGTAILLFAFTRIHAVLPAMICMGLASFSQRPHHADLVERLRRNRRPLHRDCSGGDEHARQSRRLHRPRGRRPDPAKDRLLDPAHLSHDRRRNHLRTLLALPRSQKHRPLREKINPETLRTQVNAEGASL